MLRSGRKIRNKKYKTIWNKFLTFINFVPWTQSME